MSVLIQRPHQISSMINIPRQHASSPRRQPLAPSYSHQPTVSATAPILSPKANRRPRADRSSSGTHNQTPTATTPPTPATTTPSRPPNSNNKRRSHNINNTVNAHVAPSAPLSLSSFGNSPSTVSASQPHSSSPVLSASIPPSATTTPPRGKVTRSPATTASTPVTPTPANSLPVPANRRRARSPRPTAKLPPAFPLADHDDVDTAALQQGASPARRGRRNNAPTQIAMPVDNGANSPATWQQAALLKKKPSHGSGVVPTATSVPILDIAHNPFATPVKGGGSVSTPTSPAARTTPPRDHFNAYQAAQLTHSPTMPNFSTIQTRSRTGAHARAPSVPTFPMQSKVGGLDALFSSALVLDSAPSTPNLMSRKAQHGRGASVSSSLPPVSSLHARMAAAAAAMSSPSARPRRERTLTGGKFAGASFQHAPDAMVLPKPNFTFGGRSTELSSSSSEGESSDSVVDLGEEDEDDVVFLL